MKENEVTISKELACSHDGVGAWRECAYPSTQGNGKQERNKHAAVWTDQATLSLTKFSIKPDNSTITKNPLS